MEKDEICKVKKCIACFLDKPISRFLKDYKSKKPYGRCYDCRNAAELKRRKEDPEYALKIKKYFADRFKKQHIPKPKKIKLTDEELRLRANSRHKIWKAKNKEWIIEYNLSYMKAYRQKPENKIAYRAYKVNKLATDPIYRMSTRLRKRFSEIFRKAIKKRHVSAVGSLGCTIEFFMGWLEAHFQEGMNWDNYGKGIDKWTLDHTWPISKWNFNSRAHQLFCCHYTNIKPMWWIDNVKKNNKIITTDERA